MVKMYILAFIILFGFGGCMNVNKTEGGVYSPTVGEKSPGLTEEVSLEEEVDSMENDALPERQDNITRTYFQATGNEPFWNLQIKNTGIVFSTLDTISPEFKAPFRYPERASETNDKFYDIETEEGNLQINISMQECADTMADIVFAYSVEVGYKAATEDFFSVFNGCGAYFIDPEIDGKWALESMGDRKIEVQKFEIDIPHIIINTSSNTFKGFAGCNSIEGNLFSDLELLQFTDIKSSKKICAQANTEDLFLEALKQASSYAINNDKLLLKNPTRSLMLFTKQGQN